VADPRQRQSRLHGAFVGPNLPQRLLHDRELVGRIVNDEVAREADVRRLATEQARAQGMERRDPHALAVDVEKRFDARPHLLRGFVGERHGQQPVGLAQPFADEMRDAMRYDASLTGAGAGENQQRPSRVENGFPLFRVQCGEQIHL
jgi:hypothetical protein